MKFNKKNLGHLVLLLIMGLVIGTLAWELIAKILESFSIDAAFAIGPVGFDINVLVFYIKINPGSVIGIITGILLFRRMK